MTARKPRPSYEQIADAIFAALECGLYEIELSQDGHPVTQDPAYVLARVLDKAGLIDARGVAR